MRLRKIHRIFLALLPLVRLVRLSGLSAVWFRVPPHVEARKRVEAAALTIGKAVRIYIVAVIGLGSKHGRR